MGGRWSVVSSGNAPVTLKAVTSAALPSLRELEPIVARACTERQRHALALAAAGYSLDRMAEVLDVTKSTARQHLRAAQRPPRARAGGRRLTRLTAAFRAAELDAEAARKVREALKAGEEPPPNPRAASLDPDRLRGLPAVGRWSRGRRHRRHEARRRGQK